MQTVVNLNCIGCGMCTDICKEIFKLNENGLAEAVVPEVPSDLEDKVQQAAASCPVNAIDVD